MALRKLAAENRLDVRQPRAERLGFFLEAEPVGQPDGVVIALLGVAVASRGAARRVRLVHIVVSLLAHRLQVSELLQPSLQFRFIRHVDNFLGLYFFGPQSLRRSTSPSPLSALLCALPGNSQY